MILSSCHDNRETNKIDHQVKETTSSSKDRYFVENFNENNLGPYKIYAIIKNKKICIKKIEELEMCYLDIMYQKDLDNDGNIDAIFSFESACGGNAIGTSFFVVSFIGNGLFKFNYIEPKGGFSRNLKLEQEGENWNIQCKSNGEWEGTEIFILKKGKIIKKSEVKVGEIKAIFEIKLSEVNSEDEIPFYFDLDSDGINDKIICGFWSRWNSILINRIEFSSGKQTEFNMGCKRFGVLPHITKGINDIVLNNKDVYVWNGLNYVASVSE